MIVRDLSYFLAAMSVAFTAGKVLQTTASGEASQSRPSVEAAVATSALALTDYRAAMEAKPHEYGLIIIAAWAAIQRSDSAF